MSGVTITGEVRIVRFLKRVSDGAVFGPLVQNAQGEWEPAPPPEFTADGVVTIEQISMVETGREYTNTETVAAATD